MLSLRLYKKKQSLKIDFKLIFLISDNSNCASFSGCYATRDLLFTNASDWRSARVELKYDGCDWLTAVDSSIF
jgi:hypothetical protein